MCVMCVGRRKGDKGRGEERGTTSQSKARGWLGWAGWDNPGKAMKTFVPRFGNCGRREPEVRELGPSVVGESNHGHTGVRVVV